MEIIIVVLSILLLSGLTKLSHKFFPFQICPVCAGVSGTWIIMLLLREAGYFISIPTLSILLGGSVVGIALLLEKRLPKERAPVIFKTIFIPLGFVVAYSVVMEDWLYTALLALVLIGVSFVLLTPSAGGTGEEQGVIAKLKKRMEDCC